LLDGNDIHWRATPIDAKNDEILKAMFGGNGVSITQSEVYKSLQELQGTNAIYAFNAQNSEKLIGEASLVGPNPIMMGDVLKAMQCSGSDCPDKVHAPHCAGTSGDPVAEHLEFLMETFFVMGGRTDAEYHQTHAKRDSFLEGAQRPHTSQQGEVFDSMPLYAPNANGRDVRGRNGAHKRHSHLPVYDDRDEKPLDMCGYDIRQMLIQKDHLASLESYHEPAPLGVRKSNMVEGRNKSKAPHAIINPPITDIVVAGDRLSTEEKSRFAADNTPSLAQPIPKNTLDPTGVGLPMGNIINAL
jgi:hypothetical protein